MPFPRPCRLIRTAVWLTLAALAAPAALAQAADPPKRPRIGLVLSGGGARGLAHVGVLKLLERERVPVDVIVGTSMGAIIGGLYAGGMSATRLENELLAVEWDRVFATRVSREQLSQRRKEEDFDVSPVVEIGLHEGELRVPLGALSGRGLETMLRRYTLPVRAIHAFDDLPIPFRALATDMETGKPVILAHGDLALALRSSMSVPGVFAPTEVHNQLLGDGGLVDNLPVGVARAMGVDLVIAVNVGTPLAGRDSLSSVGGLTAQMINILTEQNVQRSLASLKPDDVLIVPALGELTSSDFNQTRELIHRGEAGAEGLLDRLQALAVTPRAYAEWRDAQVRPAPPDTTLAFVRFEGTTETHPKRLAGQLESAVGRSFDPAAAARDARLLAASGDYMRSDYQLMSTPEGDGLVFDLEDKSWGPHYLRIGLDMNTDFAGRSAFNVKLSHNRHWLTENGGEWRNLFQIGEVPRWFSEVYHPLNWSNKLGDDWFIAGYGDIERREVAVYNPDSGAERGRFNRRAGRIGIDLGQPWGRLGELRIGLTHLALGANADILASDYTGPRNDLVVRETGVRVGAVIDQLDYANFPQRGYRVDGEAIVGYRGGSQQTGHFSRYEAQFTRVTTWRQHTLNAYGRWQYSGEAVVGGVGRYSLGGFQQLSGYKPGQISGNYLAFGRLIYYKRLGDSPVLARGLFAGASLEAGNAWNQRGDAKLSDLRSGMSLFLGADTGLGPVHLGLTYAPRGATGFYLVVGRP
jgi:NTE family protein